jgi:serine/threonine protein phosphatase PrpC
MEDAAIHSPNIGDGNALFAVFDGHGGNPLTIQDSKLADMSQTSSPRNS